jgi:hypothetical protein
MRSDLNSQLQDTLSDSELLIQLAGKFDAEYGDVVSLTESLSLLRDGGGGLCTDETDAIESKELARRV